MAEGATNPRGFSGSHRRRASLRDARSHARANRFVATLFSTTLAGSLLLANGAEAEDLLSRIHQRIENTFDLVVGNAAQLAIPLTRRALARRSEVEKPVEPLSYNDPQTTAAPAFAMVSPETANPPEQAWSDGMEVARLPRPRPGEGDTDMDEPGSAAADDGPIDLVAGAPEPEDEALVAVAAIEEPVAAASVDVVAAPPGADEPILPTAPVAPAAPELVAAGACLSPGDVSDKDGDFKRNADLLSGNGFCIAQEEFKERRRPWTLQTIKTNRPGPLWAVMHDDEDLSFDTAVAALAKYGGTLVTVDTGGKRNQDGIDPNRNFSADGIGCSKIGNDAAPRYTALFRALMSPQPIIALHNNYNGHIPTGGLGHASMKSAGKDMQAVPAADSKSALASQYALVLLVADSDRMDKAERRAQALAAKGINAMIEKVRGGKGDCSLSNYALLTGHDDYLNVTVNYDEGDKQRTIVDVIMAGRNDTVATQ